MSESSETAGRPEDRFSAAYQRLRGLARHYLSGENPTHTLQPTALVHEAYVRMLRRQNPDGMEANHFYALAARAMRSVLVDHARRRGRLKRGGGARRVPLDDVVDLYDARAFDLIGLDEALDKLGQVDAAQARLIELRFFGGLSNEEAGEMLGVSARTVQRDWRRARAWLRLEMGEPACDE